MARNLLLRIPLILIFTLYLYTSSIGQQSVRIPASKDNTLYEQNAGLLSNGKGQYVFAGRTGQNSNGIRRGLFQFELEGSIPPGAHIDSAALILNLSNASDSNLQILHLHRVLTAWGEGASDAEGGEGRGDTIEFMDASWIYSIYDTALWKTAGGDFIPDTSASIELGGSNMEVNMVGEAMIADLNFWIAHPDSNAGWILIGNESQPSTARRFNSTNHPDSSSRPHLFVQFTEATAVEPDTYLPELRLFPNPATSLCKLVLKNQELRDLDLTMINIYGEKLWTLDLSRSVSWSQILDLTLLPAGIYIFLLQGQKSSAHYKLTKR